MNLLKMGGGGEVGGKKIHPQERVKLYVHIIPWQKQLLVIIKQLPLLCKVSRTNKSRVLPIKHKLPSEQMAQM